MTDNSNIDIPLIRSEVTYLEMLENPRLSQADLGQFAMRRIVKMRVADYLEIYREVGWDYRWNYRPSQSDDEIIQIDSRRCIEAHGKPSRTSKP